MIYTSYKDLSDCLRKNVWKVPTDIDLIVGVPRSGMIPALMLAELLNKRCADIDTFLSGNVMACGCRERLMRYDTIRKVLVLDDTVFSGKSMRKVRQKLQSVGLQYDIIFGCVYAEGAKAKEMVDLYFEDIYNPSENRWFYEWNILHHYEGNSKSFMFDVDGLLCKEPPDERNKESYENYLPNAIPMVIPTTFIGAIVTYRLEKYRSITEEWLKKQGISYGQLLMFNAASLEARCAIDNPAHYKAMLYEQAKWAKLFLESDTRQAESIFKQTGKPVFCYENGKMYKI